MRKRPVIQAVLGVTAVAALLTPLASAHRGPHRHDHRPRAAVIVVGKPRPLRTALVINGQARGLLDLNIKPKATEVWVDGTFRGTVDAFDGFPDKLALIAGIHRIKLVTPDGAHVVRDVRVRAGVEINVGLDLR